MDRARKEFLNFAPAKSQLNLAGITVARALTEKQVYEESRKSIIGNILIVYLFLTHNYCIVELGILIKYCGSDFETDISVIPQPFPRIRFWYPRIPKLTYPDIFSGYRLHTTRILNFSRSGYASGYATAYDDDQSFIQPRGENRQIIYSQKRLCKQLFTKH